jgi:aspartyl-tRNA(Asn)/glutamyl-tRNA(Gln) amidotransferase subunit A
MSEARGRDPGGRTPAADDDLAFAPAHVQADLIARGDVSPVELVELYLGRIARLDPALHAYITVAADQARAAAREAEARRRRGSPLPPLHGVPISVKDLEATRGLRTTLGSRAFRDTVPAHDSVVVERVRRAGAIIIGKTSTPELGVSLQAVTDNALVGPCRNPWDPARTTGGSSGGAAASVAAGLCALGVGTDGGGSLRIPASFCGVVGLKPSHGRVPRAGGLGRPEPGQFSQPGPTTRSVRDAAILLQALAGPDPRDPSPELRETPPDFLRDLERGVRGLRLGWSPGLGYGVADPAVEGIAREAAGAFEALGAAVEDAPVQLEPDLSEHFWNVYGANLALAYGHLLDERPGELGDDARAVLDRARAITGVRYAASWRAVLELRVRMDETMSRLDLLLTPTTAVTAFPHGRPPRVIAGREVDAVTGMYPCLYPINMCGQPAISVPCGYLAGLPVGLHIVGRRGDEATVLRAAAALETARPWAATRPREGFSSGPGAGD